MLQSIRDKTHGWIAGIIISILILSFGMWGIHSYLVGGSTSDVVAKVNGVEIIQTQLSAATERLRRQLELQKRNDLLATAGSNLRENALQALINLQVLKQSSLNQDYRISQMQVEEYLENIPDFKVNGQFSVSRFQEMLNATLFTTNDFLDLIRSTLLIDQPRLGIIFSSFSLPNEVNDSIALINQQRDITYILLPFKSLSKSPVTLSQNTIQAYYNQHIKDFQKPETVSVEYILLSTKDLVNKIHPNDAELLKYYNETPESFNLPAQWKFISILIPIEKNASPETYKAAEAKSNEMYKEAQQGKDLTAIAHSLSIDNTHSNHFITLNNAPGEIQNALLDATKPGTLIKPIQVHNGFMIIKVIDYKKPEVQPYDKVKEQVKSAVILQRSQEQLAAAKEKLTNISYEHPSSLKPAADALGLTIQTTGLFSKDKGNDDFSNNPKIREAAFSSDVLNALNNSDVIPITNDTVVVLRIKSHSPSTSSPLSEVQQQITEKLKTIEMENRTSQLANKIISKLKAGTTPESIAKEYNITWVNPGLVTRHSTKVDPAILDQAFDLPKVEKSYGIAKITNGYAIVSLKSIQDGTLNHSEDYDIFSEQIQNTQGLLEYQLYKQSLIKKANIIIEQ